MVEFRTAYYHPMDRDYMGNTMPEVKPQANIEEPIIPVSQLGQTVTEGGRFGNLIQTATAAIRAGTGTIELQTQMGGGGEPVGAESYGKEAREAIRELAKANEVLLTSVHTPTAVGNLSGFNPQQGNFSDEHRKIELDEVKKAIKFAADAAQGGAVVVHTGEYHRPIFDASWNKEGKWKDSFISYDEEPEKTVMHLVDDRTGRVISEVRRNQVVYRPNWNRHEGKESYVDDNGKTVKPGDYIDYEGRKVEQFEERVPKYDSDKGIFETKRMTWQDFEKEAKERNDMFRMQHGRDPVGDERVTPEESFLQAQLESNIGVAKGWALNYGVRVKEQLEAVEKIKSALKYYEHLEKNASPKDLAVMRMEAITRYADGRLVGREKMLPSEILKEQLWDARKNIESSKDMATSQMQQAREQEEMKQHAVSISKYAKKKSLQSFAEAGLYAMKESQHNPHVNKDVFVAPENIFPEMGFGSHPEELIELVKGARKEMVNKLTEKYVEDPSGRKDEKGKPIMVPNPDFAGMSRDKAEELAKKHIKATLDTQHLGMWWKHFKPKAGETEESRRKRFNDWYMDEIDKLAKENILGNIHLVDSIGGGHQHLPAGQGDLPVVAAIKKLRQKGYKGFINSEAYEEERFTPGRILIETWSAFGSPIQSGYAGGAPGSRMWTDVRGGYFGQTYPPKFIFGSYSPSNDWTLWSQVPME
ncbi:sugar phosphate isomerase/epimerase [Candidatus Woesearchaeota archaeon]|nr:sugar phosphate isomerase/epimerase [Candidatus Woesearchaeota archaeon]